MESNTFKWGAKKERIESTVAMDGFKAFKFVCALNRVNVLVETLDGIAAYSEEWMNITYRRSMRHIHTTPYTHSHIYISFDMYISCICICYLYTLWISMYMHRLILLLPYFSQPNQIHVNCTARKKRPWLFQRISPWIFVVVCWGFFFLPISLSPQNCVNHFNWKYEITTTIKTTSTKHAKYTHIRIKRAHNLRLLIQTIFALYTLNNATTIINKHIKKVVPFWNHWESERALILICICQTDCGRVDSVSLCVVHQQFHLLSFDPFKNGFSYDVNDVDVSLLSS